MVELIVEARRAIAVAVDVEAYEHVGSLTVEVDESGRRLVVPSMGARESVLGPRWVADGAGQDAEGERLARWFPRQTTWVYTALADRARSSSRLVRRQPPPHGRHRSCDRPSWRALARDHAIGFHRPAWS